MKDDVKLLLGLTRDDLWALPGSALMFAAFFFQGLPVVGGLLLGAAFCFSIYMLRTLRKYWSRPGLSRTTRVLGIVGNVAVLVVIVVAAAGMCVLAAEGSSTIDYLLQVAGRTPPSGEP